MGYGGASPVPDLSGYALAAAMTSALAAKAATSAIPAAASSAPPAIAGASDKGSSPAYALADHTHKTSLQKAQVTTNGSGVASVTWGTAFPSAPCLSVLVLDATGARYTATILTNSTTACTIQIAKARLLPAVLTLLSNLLNYDVFQPAGSGVTVHIIAGVATQ
jgi:hypothetical protein